MFVPEHKAIENISQEEYLNNNTTNNSAITHFHGKKIKKKQIIISGDIDFPCALEKLFRLKTMMRTPKGKALAIERDRFMQLFVQQVNDEFEMKK